MKSHIRHLKRSLYIYTWNYSSLHKKITEQQLDGKCIVCIPPFLIHQSFKYFFRGEEAEDRIYLRWHRARIVHQKKHIQWSVQSCQFTCMHLGSGSKPDMLGEYHADSTIHNIGGLRTLSPRGSNICMYLSSYLLAPCANILYTAVIRSGRGLFSTFTQNDTQLKM